MSEIKVKPILFTGKKYSDNKSPIFIRLTKDRKVSYISVGKSANIENWDSEENRVYEKKPKITPQHKTKLSEKEFLRLKAEYKRAEVLKDAIKINSDIESKVKEVYDKIKELKDSKKPTSIKIIKDEIDSKGNENHNSFIDYANKVANDYLLMGKISSYKSCISVIEKLNNFSKNDILFDNIDVKLLKRFELYLKNDLKNKVNTRNKNFRVIRLIINKAIEEGYLEYSKNPFFIFKLSKGEDSKKVGLSIEELNTIIKLDLSNNDTLINTRNYFLFCFYNAGMRIGDLICLKWSNIANGRLIYTTNKSNDTKEIDLKLRHESLAILKKYQSKEKKLTDYVFPILENSINKEDKLILKNQIGSKTALINKNLKKIKQLAELNKPLTTHISRHSFGNVARTRNAKIIDISRALGHSSTKVTETYLQNLDKDSQDKTLDKIYGKPKL